MAFLHGLMAIPLRIPTLLLAALLLIGGHLAVQAATTTTFNSTNVPVAIPLTPNVNPMTGLGFQSGVTTSTVQVSGIATAISNVTVSLYIAHEYPQDLRLVLLAPGVTYVAPGGPNPIPPGEIILASYRAGDNATDGFRTGYGTSSNPPTGTIPNSTGSVVFSDAAATFPIASGIAFNNFVYAGTYLPQNALSGLSGRVGTQVNGTWTLRINDDADIDAGTLYSWSITITEPGPHTWTGLGTTNNWSDAANWQNNNPPTLAEAAALITFPSGAARLNNINDIGDIKVGVLSIAGGYTINNNLVTDKLTMAAGGTVNGIVGSAATATINMPVDLIGAATITTDAGVTSAMNGVIADDGAAAGSLTVNGPGTLDLQGVNQYTGATIINSGIVMVSNGASLGAINGGTIVNSGATVLVTVNFGTAEPITLNGSGSAGQGALACTVTSGWGGPITLTADSTVGAVFGTSLSVGNIPAVPAGTYGFAKVGAGDVIVAPTATLPTGTVLGAHGGGTLTIGAAQPGLAGMVLTGGTTIASGVNQMTLAGGISCSASPTVSTISGALDIGAAARVLDVASGSFLTFPGAGLTLTGAGGFAKTGAGTLTWSTNAGGVPLSMSDGTLTGAGGTMGALTVSAGIVVPVGAINTGALNLGAGSLLRINAGGNSLSATGTVTLGGGLMQPYTNTGTIIANDGGDLVVGTFRGMPFNNNGVDYQGGTGNDVALSNLGGGGTTVFFTAPVTYTATENGGSVSVALDTAGGGPVFVTLDSYGSSATAAADFILPAVVAINGPTTVIIYLVNDNLAEGDETINLVLIPNSGGFLGAQSSATITITDDDDDGGKKCGFGTGLTVFFLFGFGLLLRLRLRRR